MAKLEENLSNTPVALKSHRLYSTSGFTYFKNKSFRFYCLLSSILLGLVLLSIIVFIGKTGILVFKDVSVKEFFFSTVWDPDQEKFGAALFILGTFALTALTMVLSVPLSIGLAVFIVEVAPEKVKNIIRPLLDLLVGIPSIIYGYLGLTLLIPFLMKITGAVMGDGLLAAALVLTIMVLPTVTRLSDEAISAVPKEIREASYALGSTRFQATFKVILPAAKKGLISAVILGMARALGETMAVVMVIGNTAQLPETLLTPTAVLTSNIVMQILDVQFDSTWNYGLYMMAFILLLISNLMIIFVRRIRAKGV
ncbi:phosphate ABC transporter permease subunit PstC [Bacillus sp. MUM 116]|uniref:phosphate ABC transporter permease subunit PstC n=1 Tax=Bacillus sp. MUM 116 TaxID=1678002 RepID=UPI0008F5CF68|nr:phosphate ABC transporter permease subunit PstC [Bacillus sp. MUM 116]OIK16349.1 phosphate ABC transporter permease subunit PstC [Bacillus sp. MUM 116]